MSSAEPPPALALQAKLQALAETVVMTAEQFGKAIEANDLHIVLLLAAPDGPERLLCATQANCQPRAIEHLLRTYIAAMEDGSLEMQSKRRPFPH